MDIIFNLNETNLSCDGNYVGRGGRPPAFYIIKGVIRTGTATSKSSVSTTFITITTPKGSKGPAHVQFPSDCNEADNTDVKPA